MPNDDRRDPAALLPLTPAVLHILLALADGEKHGYAIMREIQERTGGAIRMGPGTLYGSIQRMLKDELIAEARDPLDRADHREPGRSEPGRSEPGRGEERRRYYRLTGFGARVLRAEADRLEQLVRLARGKRVLPGLSSLEGTP